MATTVKKDYSIKDDFDQLEDIVSRLSGEQEDLEESIELFKKGVRLVKRLKNQLKKVKLEIEEIHQELEKSDSLEK